MVTNIQIANSTQLSLTCSAQSVTRNIADSMDNCIPADHFQVSYRKNYLAMMDQAGEEVSWLTETDGKVVSKPGEPKAVWTIPMYTSCS